VSAAELGRSSSQKIFVRVDLNLKAPFDTLDGVVVQRPSPSPYHRQHLCLDKGYDFPEIERGVIARKYVPNMRHRERLRIR
jgi:hypothetical protein